MISCPSFIDNLIFSLRYLNLINVGFLHDNFKTFESPFNLLTEISFKIFFV